MMAAPAHPEDMLTQVTQLWSMLDEMAESTPESYHRFIQQQLEDAKQYCAPPEPHLCLQTHILDPNEKSLFINLCRWKRVPAPKSLTDPIPLSAGPLEEVSDKAEIYSIIDIAYNPTILQREENQAEMDHLIRLTFKYIEEHYNLSLSHSYHIATFTLKGSLKRMKQSLGGGPLPAPLFNKNMRNELTLDQMKHNLREEDRNNATLLLNKDVTQSKVHLIEEIASMELPEEPITPAYELTFAKDANGKPLKIELKVELPKVSSVSECELSISRDDVIVEVPEKYRLQLDLPELVDEEATTATFNKGKGVLLIIMPIS
ncbi:PIH1 domain-containing protein 2 isoform X1 [Terrapene carolina triunguis]|uniref:PIH1 domain-containing protein 2 isoform X1 n=1 Tax=Terrapene triunguis TaxID=2587831 RepID=UPI000E77F078|nr:PIH1 domain-containing protein 2 isoform X1 [Terrapene carolina triunguis]XP_029768788.1 PIH1 domain-containing protein 2 isoform X1 [Terrapene carolina triunguis]